VFTLNAAPLRPLRRRLHHLLARHQQQLRQPGTTRGTGTRCTGCARRTGSGRTASARAARGRHRQRLFDPLRVVGIAKDDGAIEHADFTRRLRQHDLAAQLAAALLGILRVRDLRRTTSALCRPLVPASTTSAGR
jgi:hypothetical protein